MSTFYAQYPESASAGANASVGANGSPAPSSSTEIAGVNGSGDLTPVSVDNSGRVNVNGAGLPTSLGQKPMAQSTSVAIASDQSAVPISAASLPLPTGAATEATLSSLNGKVVAVNTGAVVVSSSALPTGAATEATLSSFSNKSSSADVHEAYDYRSFTYVGATQKIDVITYKTGGSGGTTVATQTFGYDGSDRLTSITKT